MADDSRRELAELLQQARVAEKVASADDPKGWRSIHEYWEREFGERVRQQRIARNWSQEDLAQELRQHGFDMHQTTIAKLEKGIRPLRVSEASAIATIFGLPPLAVFRAPPPEKIPWPLEKMQETLRLAEETLERYQDQMHQAAKRYIDAQAEVSGLAEDLSRAALLADLNATRNLQPSNGEENSGDSATQSP